MTVTSIDDLEHPGQDKAFLIRGKIYRSIELFSSGNGYYLRVEYINNKIENLFYPLSGIKATKIIDDIRDNSNMIDYFQDSIRN